GGAAQLRLGDAAGPCERGGGERSRGRGAGDEAAAGQRPACHAHETSSGYRSGAKFNHFSSSSAITLRCSRWSFSPKLLADRGRQYLRKNAVHGCNNLFDNLIGERQQFIQHLEAERLLELECI